MTVSELIEMLKQHDPDAVVALRYDCDDDGVITCEELHQGVVQSAQLRRLQSKNLGSTRLLARSCTSSAMMTVRTSPMR